MLVSALKRNKARVELALDAVRHAVPSDCGRRLRRVRHPCILQQCQRLSIIGTS